MLSTLAFALLLAAPSGAPPVPAPRAPLSREQADSLARKLAVLATPAPSKRAKRSMVFTEGEINSYLNLILLPTALPTVSQLELRIENGRLTATGLVDVDQVKRQLTLSPWNPISFLRGRMPVSVSGRYQPAEDGFGRVSIDDVAAGRVPIPVSVIEQIVATSTRTSEQPDGVDIKEPFRLPRPLRGLRLEPGRALLEL
jgi:hypothetical protein